MTVDAKKHALFVEGPSDGAVVNKLVLARLGVDIAKARLVRAGVDEGEGGFGWVRNQLETAFTTRNLDRFGAVVDRDALDGKPDRWESLTGLLGQFGVQTSSLPAGGFITTTSWGARFGLWLMPDNVQRGDLEHFIETLVPTDSADRAWAKQASELARLEKGAPFKEVHARKASLHTWLAWRDPPGIPYGTAIEAGKIGASSVAADAFVEWFRQLFLDT